MKDPSKSSLVSIELFNRIDAHQYWTRSRSSGVTSMDAAKFKKLEDYVSTLGKRGAEEEKNGEYAEAIPTYLKLVDALIIMADAAPSYPSWVKCTTSAENYQKKIKSLIALAAVKQEKSEAQVEMKTVSETK